MLLVSFDFPEEGVQVIQLMDNDPYHAELYAVYKFVIAKPKVKKGLLLTNNMYV